MFFHVGEENILADPGNLCFVLAVVLAVQVITTQLHNRRERGSEVMKSKNRGPRLSRTELCNLTNISRVPFFQGVLKMFILRR